MYSPPPLMLLLPRAFLEHPLPIGGQGIASSIVFSGASGPVSLQVGLVDRWGRATATPSGLTLDRFTLFCALWVLRDRGPITYNALFRLLTPSSGTCSAHHREQLKQTLADLSTLDCALSSPVGELSFAPLVSLTPASARPVFGRPTPAFIPSFHPALLESLGDTSACTLFRFDTFLSIRSRLARALFCFLPTWAHYSRATAAKPFRISLSKLIAHLGADAPHFPSARKAFFYGHRSQGLFDELQGLPTPYGELSFAVTPAASLNDDCLLVWFARTESHPAETSYRRTPRVEISAPENVPASADPLASFRSLKLFAAWIDSGRTEADFLERVRKPLNLSSHDQELLASAGVNLSSAGRFLTLAKKLLPERTWQDLLGEARYVATAAPAAARSPQGKLIAEVLSALRAHL